jgi:hypothetical protein
MQVQYSEFATIWYRRLSFLRVEGDDADADNGLLLLTYGVECPLLALRR